MISLLVVLTPIALIYSIAILPSGIASIAASMSGGKPYLTAGAYIVGKFLPKFVFGLLIVIGLDAFFDQITTLAVDTWRNPGALAVALQLVIGSVMVIFGYRLVTVRPASVTSESSQPVTPLAAFSVGAGLTIVSLPGNVLYFAAIDQILRADLALPGVVVAVLYYNLVLMLPLILLGLSRRLFGARADALIQSVSDFVQRRGKRLLFLGVLGVGVLLVVDAVGWFAGFPVLPSYIR